MNRQRGMSLIIVLIALVIISFAATALLRSTDTATLITGNLAFKKAALASGDAAAEQALAWINANGAGTTLQTDQPASGYYATSSDSCDLTGTRTPDDSTDNVNWSSTAPAANCAMVALQVTPAGVASGYTTAYVINRMCNAAGDPLSLLAADGFTPMTCSRISGGSTTGSTRTGAYYGNMALSGASQVYFRITARISGPRFTVRYLQTFIAM
jgi:type II secretory pathway pseudopilin PulG